MKVSTSSALALAAFFPCDSNKDRKAFAVLNPGVKAEEKKKAGLDPQKDYTTDLSCVQCHTTGNSTMFPGIKQRLIKEINREYKPTNQVFNLSG